MGDMGELFNEYKKDSQVKRNDNVQSSTQLLIDHDIDFTVHNNGYHLIVTYERELIDFWPSTGKWIPRETGKHYRGVRKLIQYIKY